MKKKNIKFIFNTNTQKKNKKIFKNYILIKKQTLKNLGVI
jgi:hypothetical protein